MEEQNTIQTKVKAGPEIHSPDIEALCEVSDYLFSLNHKPSRSAPKTSPDASPLKEVGMIKDTKFLNIYLTTLLRLLSKRIEMPLSNMLESVIFTLRNANPELFSSSPAALTSPCLLWHYILQLSQHGCITICKQYD